MSRRSRIFTTLISFMLCSQGLLCAQLIGPVESEGEVVLPTQPTDLIAVVDGAPILLKDVTGPVETRIKQMVAAAPAEPSERELRFVRNQLIRRELAKEIQGKMMYRAFLKKMSGNEPIDKRAEIEASIKSNVRKMFYEQQMPKLLEQYKLTTVSEADAELRKTGSSLEQQERRFIESVLGQEYLREELDQNPEIPLPDMKHYYEENLEQFRRKARARWEQLSVYFSKFESKTEADVAIRRMGTEAYFGGNMQAVARKNSQEPLASETGGLHDWTRKGSLASETLDEKIFSIPLNQMSRVIEDDNGFHIIKVLDREPAGIISFAAAQEEIREKLQNEVRQKQQKKVIENLANKIPVWSIYPDDVPKARPLVSIAANGQQNLK